MSLNSRTYNSALWLAVFTPIPPQNQITAALGKCCDPHHEHWAIGSKGSGYAATLGIYSSITPVPPHVGQMPVPWHSSQEDSSPPNTSVTFSRNPSDPVPWQTEHFPSPASSGENSLTESQSGQPVIGAPPSWSLEIQATAFIGRLAVRLASQRGFAFPVWNEKKRRVSDPAHGSKTRAHPVDESSAW
jgi:hypothetical protein